MLPAALRRVLELRAPSRPAKQPQVERPLVDWARSAELREQFARVSQVLAPQAQWDALEVRLQDAAAPPWVPMLELQQRGARPQAEPAGEVPRPDAAAQERLQQALRAEAP